MKREDSGGSPASERGLRVALWSLRVVILTLALVALARTSTMADRPFWSATGMLLLALAVAGARALAPPRGTPLAMRAEAVVLGFLAFNGIGSILGFYLAIPFYDEALHVLFGAAAVFVVYAVAHAWDLSWLWRAGTPVETGAHAFMAAVTLGVILEFVEYALTLGGLPVIIHMYGTVRDLAADALGALLASVVAARVTREAPDTASARSVTG